MDNIYKNKSMHPCVWEEDRRITMKGQKINKNKVLMKPGNVYSNYDSSFYTK